MYILGIKVKMLSQISQLNVKSQNDYWGFPAMRLAPGSGKLYPKRIRWKVREGNSTIPSRLYIGTQKCVQLDTHEYTYYILILHINALTYIHTYKK